MVSGVGPVGSGPLLGSWFGGCWEMKKSSMDVFSVQCQIQFVGIAVPPEFVL